MLMYKKVLKSSNLAYTVSLTWGQIPQKCDPINMAFLALYGLCKVTMVLLVKCIAAVILFLTELQCWFYFADKVSMQRNHFYT